MSSPLLSPTTVDGGSHVTTSTGGRCAPQDAVEAAAWAFYESGLVHGGGDVEEDSEGGDGGGGGGAEDEDTEDELETADWIRFERARAHSRHLAARQQEQRQHRQQPQQQTPPVGANELTPASANFP
ncbi:hypothetical protein PybrP1_004546 [[Pythium] brassicae (nom. inval.)]|nr:hypothetical protein PybrP1_004546 [[Pythium] brassicae (nom. inval.)]